ARHHRRAGGHARRPTARGGRHLRCAAGHGRALRRRSLGVATHRARRAPLPGRRLERRAEPPELDDRLLLDGGIQHLGPNEFALYKPRWGAFYDTPLDTHLRGLGVSTLVFAGCNFPNCPRTSIYEASERDYRTVLAVDAVSGAYDRGLAELAGIGVHLLTVDEIEASLGGSARGA